jgi:Cohesin domain
MRIATRKAVLLAVLFGLATFVVYDATRDRPSTEGASKASKRSERTPEAAAKAEPAGAEQKQAGQFVLPERAPFGEPRADLFGSRSWQPPPPKVAPAPPPKPVAPPMPYRFAGQLIQGERPEVLLAKDDTVIPVGKGDTLDGVYRVEGISETQITLLYLPLKQTQTIPVFGVIPVTEAAEQTRTVAAPTRPQTAIASAPSVIANTPAPPAAAAKAPADGPGKPARLLWQGPENVKMGTPFSVTLKVNSEQPVRASPMELKFDPRVLESVDVKPGRFFGENDRNFSYRVARDGSIFVGASNQGPEAATDAEFIVLTFRPLKAASVAELSIASLSLQGAAGRMISFDPLVAFKTTIAP